MPLKRPPMKDNPKEERAEKAADAKRAKAPPAFLRRGKK